LISTGCSYCRVRRPDSTKNYGGKTPYIKMDCSGLITAARIQEIGSENNQNYRLGWINVAAYVNHGYWYPDVNGEWYSTETIDIDATVASRGDLIALRKINEDAWRHIVLLDRIYVDRVTGYIYRGHIIHAKGDAKNPKRRVKYDNLIGIYRPFMNGPTPFGGTWEYRLLRFENE